MAEYTVQAWGKCMHCTFVGDLWWDMSVEVALCPECNCETPSSAMPEYPSDE